MTPLIAALAFLCSVSAGADLEPSLRASLKSTAVVFRAPDVPWLYPERNGAQGLWRLRLEPELRAGEDVTVAAAWEQRIQLSPSSSAGNLPGLPRAQTAPWRIADLEPEVASGSGFLWTQELDRAFVSTHLGQADLTVGRQAVGWGRGMVLSAVDLFAPFSPLEVDREWRRGVDALRADVRLGEQASVEGVAALGPSLDTSLLGVRARGFYKDLDGELLFGRRAADPFVGASASAALGGFEVHGEAAVFHLPEPWLEDGPFGRRWIPRAALGGSYVVGVGTGLTLAAEYQYSGFGVSEPALLLPHLAQPAFQERYLRGDFQLLGRHAVAVIASYALGLEGNASLTWLQDPRDGSAILAPALSWSPDDRLALIASAYAAFGERPAQAALRSQFGGTPLTALVQVQVTEAVPRRP